MFSVAWESSYFDLDLAWFGFLSFRQYREIISIGASADPANADHRYMVAQDTASRVLSRPGTVTKAKSPLPQAKVSAGTLASQNMRGFGSQGSGGAQLFRSPPSPVDTPIRNWPNLSAQINVPRDSRQAILIYDGRDSPVSNAAASRRGEGPPELQNAG